MSSAIVWGAGREGRGFLGDIFSESGFYPVYYVDNDKQLVKDIAENGFHILVITPDGDRTLKYVKDVQIFLDSSDRLGEIVADSEEIAITVYPASFADVAGNISNLMLQNKERCIKKNILLCVNVPSPIETFRKAMENGHTPEECKWLSEICGISQCLVHRTSVTPPKEILQNQDDKYCVLTNGYHELIVDGSKLIRPIGEGNSDFFSLCPDIAFAEHRKLFTYNMLHAIYSYCGHLKGYTIINESAADEHINQMAHEAIEKLTRPFCEEFNVSEKEMQDYYEKMWKYAVHPALKDEIRRLAVDPIRKLGINDRIIGPLNLCYKYGVINEPLIQTAKAALSYVREDDPSSLKLQEMLSKEGISETIEYVCGLKKDTELNALISKIYGDHVENPIA